MTPVLASVVGKLEAMGVAGIQGGERDETRSKGIKLYKKG
jgi:hypothetical protein